MPAWMYVHADETLCHREGWHHHSRGRRAAGAAAEDVRTRVAGQKNVFSLLLRSTKSNRDLLVKRLGFTKQLKRVGVKSVFCGGRYWPIFVDLVANEAVANSNTLALVPPSPSMCTPQRRTSPTPAWRGNHYFKTT